MQAIPSLRAVHAVTRAIASAASFDEVCAIAIDCVLATLLADRASLLLADEQGVFRFRAWRGLSDAYRQATEGHNPWEPDDAEPAVVTMPDVQQAEGLGALRDIVLSEGIRALAFVPLASGARLLGKFMVYFDRPHAFTEDELCIAQILGEQLGFALARFRAEDQAYVVGEELRAVLDAVDEGVTVQEPSGRLRYVNDAAARLSGFASAAEMMGVAPGKYTAAFQLLTEDGRPMAVAELPNRKALQGERAEGLVGYAPAGGGEVKWSRVTAKPCLDRDGLVRFAVVVTQDITQARRDAESRRFLLEAAALLSASLDIEVTLAAVAGLLVPRMADWCAVALLGPDGTAGTIAVQHRDPTKVALAHQLATAYPTPPDADYGTELVRRTGEPWQLREITPEMLAASAVDEEHARLLRELDLRSVLVLPLKAGSRVVGTLTLANAESKRSFDDGDLLVARKLADRAGVAVENARLYSGIREAQEKLALAMEAGRMGNWEYVVADGEAWWSPAVAALHGSTPEAFDGTFDAFMRHVAPEDRERVEADICAALDAGDSVEIEYRVRPPDGSTRWLEGRGRVYRDEHGKAQRLAGFFLDVTDRKETARALEAEHERLSVTLSSIGDAVIATDAEGRVTLMNGVAEALTGWIGAEACGRPLTEVFPIFSERTGRPVQNPVEEVLRTGRIVGLANHTCLVARDGTRRSIADSAAPIHDSGGSCIGVVLVFRDVTHQERLEREMAKASKLESIGVLAGGIAHDFNNILTAIIANVSLAEHRLVQGHPAQARLLAARTACDRARDLTRQLLTFSRGGAPVKAATSIVQVLQEACGFALQGSNVRAEFAFGDALWAVDADAGQVSQVVHNLVLNAAQAMPKGGRIFVEAENTTIEAGSWLPLAPGRYVRFSVADGGPGISLEALPRIFDPFFTTKPNGTGLGLATSYSVVHRHGGHIAVESPVGGGALFTVHLPVADTEVAPLPARGPAPRGKGRVLVMDDDPAILELAGECLRELGYDAEFAADGAAAIERYHHAHATGAGYDVVVMDLTVPGGLGGKETLRRLQQQYPGVRAIVSSGYSNDPVMAGFREYGFLAAIQKPYALDELARVLEACVSGG